MRENNIPLAASNLQLQCNLDTPPLDMLNFNNRYESITTYPPAERIFSLTPQNVPPQFYGFHPLCQPTAVQRPHTQIKMTTHTVATAA